MPNLTKGSDAPSFELKDQSGKIVKNTDYRGKKLLLYFYPKANTPGCTKQACSIRDSRDELTARGVAYVGVSPDTPQKQKKFDDKYNLKFPLLADTDNLVAKAYGVWGEKSMYGKKYEGIIRSSFLIDEQGKIIEAWYKVKPEETVSKVLEAL